MYAGSNEWVIDPLRTLLDPLKAGDGRCGHEQFTHRMVSSCHFSPQIRKNSTSSSPIIYHGNGPSLAKLFNRFSHLTWSSYVLTAFSLFQPVKNTIERSFSAAAHIMNDLRCMLDPSHLDELVILRSVYRLHHAADSQLACDEDED